MLNIARSRGTTRVVEARTICLQFVRTILLSDSCHSCHRSVRCGDRHGGDRTRRSVPAVPVRRYSKHGRTSSWHRCVRPLMQNRCSGRDRIATPSRSPGCDTLRTHRPVSRCADRPRGGTQRTGFQHREMRQRHGTGRRPNPHAVPGAERQRGRGRMKDC